MKKEKQSLPAQKMSITSMSALIHTDSPDLYWQNEQTGQPELCRKKLIYAEELYQALGLAPSQRSRSIAKWKERGFEGIDWNNREVKTGRGRGAGSVMQSAYLRVEFAKKICMQINTPIADAVRDYLIKETAAFWAAAKRQALAVVDPAAQPQIQLSDAVRQVVEKAVSEAVAVAIQETNQRNQEASRTLYNQKFALLEDLKTERVDERNRSNLRAHISNMVRKHCFEHGEDYKVFWEKCYNSFKVRHKSCDWFWAFSQAKNKVEFIAENLPLKYLQEFHQIVISFILEYR
ncbi:MAG: hypothetical protein IJQ55_01990 [Alphaproteobacteria bacterium]|nr:hypothetical protein [Alphaproteobacteria bacterium]